MSVAEVLLRGLAELKPILPYMLIAVILTVAALIFLLFYSRNVWVDSRRFRMAGLFFGLNRQCSLRLACVWLKLIFMVSFVLGFRKLGMIHYISILIIGITAALCAGSVRNKISSLLWLLLQMAGLISVNLICGYMKDMAVKGGFMLIYIAMGLFLILFSVYMFLSEINAISVYRDVDAERIWMHEEE